MEVVKLNISGFKHILPFPTFYFADKDHCYKGDISSPIAEENKTNEQVSEINLNRIIQGLNLEK